MTDPREKNGSPPGKPSDDKWRFLRVSAHQLHSPVATINMQMKSILGGFYEPVPSSVRQVLEGVERKTRDLLGTVNEMLELARLADAEGETAYEPQNLEELVVAVRDAVEMKARAKGVAFNVEIPSTLPTVWVKPGTIRHVLFNLAENAVKYTPSGGQVTIRLHYAKESGALEGRVADTGIGIPAESRPQLFTEFFRAPNAREAQEMGTGLGLAIVKRIIDAYKGGIEVESDVGKGTTVSFRIPLNRVSDLDKEKLAAAREKPRRRIVVIGGRAAGPKAAAKALRLDPDAEITVVEKERFLSYAGCGLPLYLSGQVDDPRELMTTPDGDIRDPDFFRRVKGIAVYNRAECVVIDRKTREVEIRFQKTGDVRRLPYDKLILATGGRPILPSVEGLALGNVFTLTRIDDARGLRTALNRLAGGEAVIVGGGLIGMESAEALSTCGLRVTVLEARERVLPMLDPELALLVERHYARRGVRIMTGEKAMLLEGRDGKVVAVRTDRGVWPASIVIFGTGVAPETTLARSAGLEIGTTGGLVVNEWLQTSDPDIYAIGDCVENTEMISGRKVYVPLGSVANRHGRVAGTNVITHAESFPGVVGTMVLRGFGLNIGAAGLSEREARAAGFKPLTVVVAGADREHYYPGAETIVVKIVGDETSGRLLGVQAVGRGDVSKRIDVAAALLAARETVDTLSKLDLGYAPPFSTPMDILCTAANVYKNKLYRRLNGISALELERRRRAGEDLALVDVRNPSDYASGAIPGALSIPLRSLRGRLHELPRGRAIVFCCSTGLNSYEAQRVLESQGFRKVEVLEGGLEAWPFETV